MGKYVAIFLICFALAFGGGYLFYQTQGNQEAAEDGNQAAEKDQVAKEDEIAKREGDSSANEGRILVQRGCISCHSVSALNMQGGATGPDLSKAYVNVQDKHGVAIEEYLKKPTSAVMSGVLGGKPLTEEELAAVLAALKVASEK